MSDKRYAAGAAVADRGVERDGVGELVGRLVTHAPPAGVAGVWARYCECLVTVAGTLMFAGAGWGDVATGRVCFVKPGFDLDRALAGGVCDADGAWRFIREFAKSCAGPIVAGDGCDDDELRAAEARLGLALPASLRQAYVLMGRRDDLTRVQDRLLSPAELCLDATGQVLIFRVENQNVAQWGVPLSAVGEPDPPVVFLLDSLRPEERVWQPFLDRVSLACMEMVLSEWMLSSDACCDNRALSDETVSALEKRFRRLPMPDYPLWAKPSDRPVRWFCREGVVLRDDAGGWLWVRASSPEEIAAVRQALPGDWLMVDGW